MAIRIRFDVETEFDDYLKRSIALFPRAQESASVEIRNGIWSNVLYPTLLIAAEEAGPGWPDAYTQHIARVMRHIPINTTFGADFVLVDVDVDALGSTSDLVRGYHYHAILRNQLDPENFTKYPARVVLPWTGSEGELNDPEKRLDFWEALVNGDTYIPGSFDGHYVRDGAWALQIDTFGMYDETIQARIAAWGNKAPEWIQLDNGIDGGSSMDTPPTHFSEMLNTNAQAYCSEIYIKHMERVIAAAETAGGGRVEPVRIRERERTILRGPTGRFIG